MHSWDTTMVPTHMRGMTRLQNAKHLYLMYTKTTYPIGTTLIYVRLVPKDIFHIMHELFRLVEGKVGRYYITCMIALKV